MATDKSKPSESSWWVMVLAGLGMAACCGGPFIVGWVTSLGLAAAVGTWWSRGHGWMAGGAVAMALALVSIWGVRRFRTRSARKRWAGAKSAGWVPKGDARP